MPRGGMQYIRYIFLIVLYVRAAGIIPSSSISIISSSSRHQSSAASAASSYRSSTPSPSRTITVISPSPPSLHHHQHHHCRRRRHRAATNPPSSCSAAAVHHHRHHHPQQMGVPSAYILVIIIITVIVNNHIYNQAPDLALYTMHLQSFIIYISRSNVILHHIISVVGIRLHEHHPFIGSCIHNIFSNQMMCFRIYKAIVGEARPSSAHLLYGIIYR